MLPKPQTQNLTIAHNLRRFMVVGLTFGDKSETQDVVCSE